MTTSEETIMTLRIEEIVGRNCITFEDGQRIYELVDPVLREGSSLTLDFTGVDVFASPFFNAAVGQLLRDVDPERLRTSLVIAGLSEGGDQVLRRVIENAKLYWRDDGLRARLDAALMEQAKSA